jgi:hypothetical protein
VSDDSQVDELERKRIQKRGQRVERGPWKWQILDMLQRQNELIEAMAAEIRAQNETRRKLSDAGKKSAAARLAKLGTNAPPGSAAFLKKPAEVPDESSGMGAAQMSLVPEGVHEPVQRKPKKAKLLPLDGGIIWAAYEGAYTNRHGVKPIRNLKVNAQCKQIAEQVGRDVGMQLAAYYVTRNDAFYLNAKHPLGLLLMNLQKIHTEWANGREVTMRDAQRQEAHSQTDRAIREYSRTCSEQVQERNTENAEF